MLFIPQKTPALTQAKVAWLESNYSIYSKRKGNESTKTNIHKKSPAHKITPKLNTRERNQNVRIFITYPYF